jgi:hypothetical protein
MKRTIIFAAMLVVTMSGARADSSIYSNVLGQPRGDDALQADAQSCDQRFGAVQVITLSAISVCHCERSEAVQKPRKTTGLLRRLRSSQ